MKQHPFRTIELLIYDYRYCKLFFLVVILIKKLPFIIFVIIVIVVIVLVTAHFTNSIILVGYDIMMDDHFSS